MHVWYPLPWVLPAIAIIMVVFSLMYYYLLFKVFSGLVTIDVKPDFEIAQIWTTRVILIGAGIVLILAGGYYQTIAAFVFPWLLTTFMFDVLTTLVKMELLEIRKKDE